MAFLRLGQLALQQRRYIEALYHFFFVLSKADQAEVKKVRAEHGFEAALKVAEPLGLL